jgi:hypothetical protein
MASTCSIPSEFKIVDATAGCVTTNGGVTGKYVSLKNAHKATLILSFTQAVANATAVTLKMATAVAGTGVDNIPANVPIWANEDTAAGDALVVKTAAKAYTVANDAKKKQVIFEIDPSTLNIAGGFDVAGFAIADSTQATNFVSGIWILETRYAQATPPTAVTD